MTNIDAAEKGLFVYNQEREGGELGQLVFDYETDIIDLISDLLHLASFNRVNPYLVLRSAQEYYETELRKGE